METLVLVSVFGAFLVGFDLFQRGHAGRDGVVGFRQQPVRRVAVVKRSKRGGGRG